MKGINEWVKDLKHDEKVAKKFEGVKSVEDILNIAKDSGYEFTKQELLDFDLDSVAGGAGGAVAVDVEVGDVNAEIGDINLQAIGDVTVALTNATMTGTATGKGKVTMGGSIVIK